MITINNMSLDYKIQNENIKSLKEYLVNAAKHKVSYRTFRAVDNISLHIPKGQVCGIIGNNGAGKSTLLKVIAGVLTPTSGSIHVEGTVAPMLELGAGFDQDLTAKENIFLNGAILGYSRDFLTKKYNDIVDFSELGDFINQPVRTFSSGMMMRLAFSIATLVDPEILIVDEILSVGDVHFKKKSEARMKELMSGGTTVIMVSHVLSQIKELCSRVVWMEKGKIVMDGDPEKVCGAYVRLEQK